MTDAQIEKLMEKLEEIRCGIINVETAIEKLEKQQNGTRKDPYQLEA